MANALQVAPSSVPFHAIRFDANVCTMNSPRTVCLGAGALFWYRTFFAFYCNLCELNWNYGWLESERGCAWAMSPGREWSLENLSVGFDEFEKVMDRKVNALIPLKTGSSTTSESRVRWSSLHHLTAAHNLKNNHNHRTTKTLHSFASFNSCAT